MELLLSCCTWSLKGIISRQFVVFDGRLMSDRIVQQRVGCGWFKSWLVAPKNRMTKAHRGLACERQSLLPTTVNSIVPRWRLKRPSL